MMDVLVHYREQMRYVLHEFVIMPDHLHLLLTPEANVTLERPLQLIKGGFSYRLGKAKRGPVWQESFTNHRIRDQHDYERHAGYIRMNPVRARLVEAGDVSVFVGERQVRKNVRKKNNERRKPCDLRQPFPEARLPNQLTPSGTTCKSVYLWKSGHSWPRCGNAKECRPLGPGACRAKAGRSIESFTRF